MIPLKTNSLYLFNLDCTNSAENLENGSNEIKFLIGGTYRQFIRVWPWRETCANLNRDRISGALKSLA